MSEEVQPGAWHMEWDAATPAIVDSKNRPVATVAEAPRDIMLARAGLIAAAPELYDAVKAALDVFRAMAEYGEGREALTGQDMIPSLQSALDGANFLGAATPEVLGVESA